MPRNLRAQRPEDIELRPLDSEERQLTRAEVQMQLATAARGILRPSRDEDDWKKKRRQPKVGTRLQFKVARRPLSTAGEHPAAVEYALDAPLHLTDTERGMVEGFGASGDSAESRNNDPETESPSESLNSEQEEERLIGVAMQVIGATTEINPVTLTFVDSDMEQAYVHFAMSQQGFIAGKIYAFLAGVIAVGLLFPYFNFEMTPEKWTQTTVVILFTGVSIGWLMLGLMFLKVLLPMRELIFFLAVATHWPAFATATILSKEDGAYRYTYTTLCFMFCCFVAQPRFVGMFFFLTVTPIATCFIATFASTHYWEQHSRFEMLYWLMPLFPLFMLRIFERRSREAFVENRRGEAAMEVLAQREAVTRRIIARFFPVTASQRLLATRGMEPSSVFPGTALVMVAVAGFTEWAAQTSAEMVVSRVAGMFVAMERLARRYGVEKVTTLGDMYLGAAFPTAAEQLSCEADATSTDSVNGGRSAPGSTGVSFGSCSIGSSSKLSTTSGGSAAAGGVAGSTPSDAELPAPASRNVSLSENISNVDPSEPTPREVGSRSSLSAVSAVVQRMHENTTANSNSATAVNGAETRMSGSYGTQAIPVTAAAKRCHKVLRFATAVRHHRETLPTRIGVHVGTVIGGFVGIQPPKYDLFGAAVERVKELETRGRARRVHASLEMVEMASELGEPSADFDASDAGGQIFSSWRSRKDADGTPIVFNVHVARHVASAHAVQFLRPSSGTAVVPIDESEADYSAACLEDQSLLLCAYVARFGQAQRDKAMRGFETRDDILRRSLAKAIALAEGSDTSPQTFSMGVSPPLATGASPAGISNSSPSVADSPAILNTSLVQLAPGPDDGAGGCRSNGDGAEPLAGDDGSDLVAPSEQGSNPDAGRPIDTLVPSPLGDGDVLAIVKPGDEKKLYTFSMLRMQFDDPSVEGQYRRLVISSMLSRELYMIFDILLLFVAGAAVANGCMVSDESKGQALLAVTAFSLHLAYLHYIGTSHGWNFLTVAVTYSAVAWSAALLYRDDCGTAKDHRGIGSNIISMYFNQLAISPSFNLETPMPLRMLCLFIHTGQFCAAIAVRRAWIGDEVLIWDGLPLGFIAAFSFLSLFLDMSMRTGFQATMRRRALQSNRAEQAERTTTALEMMVPAFVVERLLKAARRGARRANDGADSGESIGLLADESESQLSGNSGATRLSAMTGALSTMSSGTGSTEPTFGNRSLMGERTLMKSDAAHAMLTRRSEQVWPYPRSVVMFVSFAPPVLTYEAISDTVMRIEAVARGRSIQKVKSIGTTVLLVAGIDGSLQFEDAAVNAVEAALEIQRRVFPARQAEGWWHRVGVHSGPIFGAVIGSQGLAFGIYGDTVTTAAAVAGSAPENTVRCTGAVRQVLPMDDANIGFVLAAQPLALEIRGKGAIQVFGVHERAVGAAGPRPPGAMAAGAGGNTRGDAAGGEGNSPRSMPSSDSDERVPGSVIADSIRSSLRSAAMLPSAAAPVDGLLESGFMSVDGAVAAARFPDDEGGRGDDVGKGFTPTDERTSVSERRTSSAAGTEAPVEQSPAAPSAAAAGAAADRTNSQVDADDGFGGAAACGFAYDDEIDGFSDED